MSADKYYYCYVDLEPNAVYFLIEIEWGWLYFGKLE